MYDESRRGAPLVDTICSAHSFGRPPQVVSWGEGSFQQAVNLDASKLGIFERVGPLPGAHAQLRSMGSC